MRHFADTAKARKLFNYSSHIDIGNGIELYISWFKAMDYNLSDMIKKDVVFNW